MKLKNTVTVLRCIQTQPQFIIIIITVVFISSGVKAKKSFRNVCYRSTILPWFKMVLSPPTIVYFPRWKNILIACTSHFFK